MELCNQPIENRKTGRITRCVFSKHCPIHTAYWKKVWKTRARFKPGAPTAKEMKRAITLTEKKVIY